MNIQNYIERINEFIEFSNNDDKLELEMRVKDSINNKIDKDTFIRVLKRIKGIPGMNQLPTTETLEISYEYELNKTSSTRIIINTQGSIKKYCSSNKLDDIVSKNITFLKKRPVYQDNNTGEIVISSGLNKEIIEFFL